MADPYAPPATPRKSKRALEKANWDSPKVRRKFIVAKTWKFFFTLLVPILFLPIFLWKPSEEKGPHAAYVIAIMSTFWISECLPLPVTSFLPIVLLPLFGISSSDAICSVYFNNTIIFLFGGCVIALAFEYSNLHTRISFFVMKSMGAKASVLLFGMMGTCMVLSCWMNNTSTTAMMVPCITVIMDQYKTKLLPEEDASKLADLYGHPNHPQSLPAPSEAIPNPVENSIEGGGGGISGDIEQQLPSTDLPAPARMSDPLKTVSFQNVPEDTLPKSKDQMHSRLSSMSLATSATSYWESVIDKKRKELRNLEIMFFLGVAFASNIGGTGVITGTGTNLIATAELRTARADMIREFGILGSSLRIKRPIECTSTNEYWDLDFLRWIILNVFPMIVNTFLTWAFLSMYFQGMPQSMRRFWNQTILRKRPDPMEKSRAEEDKEISSGIKTVIQARYNQLGKTTLHECFILIFFACLVALWMLRNPMFGLGTPVLFVRGSDGLDDATLKLVHPKCFSDRNPKLKQESTWGWARFFGDKCDSNFVHDTVSTFLVCLLFFILPRDPVYYKNALKGGLGLGLEDPVLPISYVAENIPWGPFLMLGGGFGISKAIQDSDLDNILSSGLQNWDLLKQMNIEVLLGVLLFVVAVMTCLASNTATAVIVSPVLIKLAQTKGYPPIFLLVPPVVGASFAFCLPISTPPNAIVYDKAKMKQTDMFLPGFFVTIICNSVLYVFTLFWTRWLLNVNSYSGACDIGVQEVGRSNTIMERSLIILNGMID